MPSLSQLPATDLLLYPGTMAIKHAANKPAPRDHSSDVKRYVAMAVRPLKILYKHVKKFSYNLKGVIIMMLLYLNTGARNTQISLMCIGIFMACNIQCIVPDVIIRPGYTVPPTIRPRGYHARSSNQFRKLQKPCWTMQAVERQLNLQTDTVY